eukprot:335136_1
MSSTQLTSILIYGCISVLCNSQWTSVTNPSPPSGDLNIALGSYNHSIFLVGGSFNSYRLLEYRIGGDTFLESEVTSHVGIWGSGDYYTQIDNLLYTITSTGDYLARYDMSTNAFTSKWHIMDTAVSGYGCLTSTDAYLFVVGGKNGASMLNTLQVLALNSTIWIQNVSSMNEARGYLSCQVDPFTSTLFAIGGYNSYTLNTIERISIHDIQHQMWHILSDTLTKPAAYTRSVIHGHLIYVIGGYDLSIKLDEIHILDPVTETVYLANFVLPEARYSIGAIIAYDVLYIFGGIGEFYGETAWMKYEFPPTSSATSQPSNDPSSSAPTSAPTTVEPTYAPTTTKPTTAAPNTTKPSKYSSLQPSELRLGPVNGYWNLDCPDSSNPLTIHFTQYLCMYHNYSSNCTFMTLTPTVHPTQETLEPTHNPTVNPSYPTQNPSVNPSKFPTRRPSMIPSINPSAYPTHYPTNNPIIYPTASPMMITSLATTNPTRSPLDSLAPSSSPTRYPTATPSQPPVVAIVTSHPVSPTGYPSNTPSGLYTTRYPTGLPSQPPVVAKVTPNPSKTPSQLPVVVSHPTPNPSLHPSVSPTGHPSTMPSVHPTYTPQPTRQQDANVDHDERSTTQYLDYNIQDNDQSAGLNELVLTLFIVSISLCITVGVVGVCLFSRIRHNKALAKQIAVVMSKTLEEDANETVKIPKQSSDTPGTVGMANAPGTVGMHNTYDLLWSMPMNSVMTMSRSPGSDDGNVMNDLEPQSDGDVVTRGGHDDDQMHVTADVFDEGTEEGNENMNEGAVVMETKGGTRGGPGQTPPPRVLHEDFENVDQNVSNLHSICFVNAANMDEVIVDEEEDGMITTGGMDTVQ